MYPVAPVTNIRTVFTVRLYPDPRIGEPALCLNLSNFSIAMQGD